MQDKSLNLIIKGIFIGLIINAIIEFTRMISYVIGFLIIKNWTIRGAFPFQHHIIGFIISIVGILIILKGYEKKLLKF